nr:hypothetical protein P5631_10825 [Bacillus subtilis]
MNTDKELMAAIKVENFSKIRLRKKYPDYKVFVSTDKKIFWELEKVEQRLKKNDMNKKNLKNDLNKLKSLMKEQT